MLKTGLILFVISIVLLFMGELPGNGGMKIIQRGTGMDDLRGIGMLIGFFGGGFLVAVAVIASILDGVKNTFKK